MSVHTYRIILVGFALLAGATAGAQTNYDYNSNRGPEYGTTSGTTTGTTTAAPNTAGNASTMAMPKSDAEIAAILDAANSAEIEAAKLAQTRGTNSEVKSFAQSMVDAHSKNDSQGDALISRLKIKPSETATSRNLKSQASLKMKELNSKTGADFDRAYLDSQVTMHQQVATDLQSRLIPAAKNPEFRTFLQDTLTHVQSHLSDAEKLKSAMASDSSGINPGTGTGTRTMKK